ncbi:hypothetical protein NP233_g11329 [Leucocoprinus birnbaumii]|uniref:Uncharacterized protein n=1 Tax=Leucocoprinus birnbaumii TaxID=56174 RepID=A0AAD5VJ46_9AGAR|nr:hypothetical protein NP233_g11329 [Leucocoprinus birnbaumii]
MSIAAALPWVRSPAKLAQLSLTQARCQIFQTAFNPTSVRTGAKYLRRRLKGPSMVAYYPPQISISKIVSQYPELEMVNEDEQTRLEDIEFKKKRGKGAPKKQKKDASKEMQATLVSTDRHHALQELLSSERTYADGLALIRDVYLHFLLEGHIASLGITRDDIKLIFGNITEIATFSESLCEALEMNLGDLLNSGQSEANVGALLLSIIPELERLYKPYTTRHSTALRRLHSLARNHPALQNRLKHIQTLASTFQSDACDLPSLLIKPVHRLLNYPRLLTAIINETPNVPDNLITARKRLEEVAKSVNEDRKRLEVVHNTLLTKKISSAPRMAGVSLTAVRPRILDSDGAPDTGRGNDQDLEEVTLVSYLESELHCIETFTHQFAKNIVEWARMTSNVILSLRNWSLSFSKIVGLSPSSSSEAFDAYLVVVEKQLMPLCVDLEAVISQHILKDLAKLLMAMTQPLKLLESMNEQEPYHHHLMNMKVSPKNRPPPSLLSASTNYLALRGQLAAELPTYISLLHQGLKILIHRLAAIQTEFYSRVRDLWAALREMLRSEEEELNGGGEETINVWFARWSEVHEVLIGLSMLGIQDTESLELLTRKTLKDSEGTPLLPHKHFLYPRSRKIVIKFASHTYMQRLVSTLKGHEAQCMANFLNEILSDGDALSNTERKHVVALLAKIAAFAQVFPRKRELQGIECDFSHPENEGAFGLIYKGRLQGQGQRLCIKAVRMYEKQDSREMLKAHAKDFVLSAYLNHPNVLPVYGIWLPSGKIPRICIVSPWLEKGDLSHFLRASPHSDPLPLICDIAAGMEYLHTLDIIHSDLKASNILVSSVERAVIADFGISRIRITNHVTSQQSKGTLNWMAPELLLEASPSTRESDIWAFGCVCYEIFTGEIPFSEYKLPARLIAAFARGPLTPTHPEVLRNGPGIIDKVVWDTMQKCWDRDPARRPAAEELCNFFKTFIKSDDRPLDSSERLGKDKPRVNEAQETDYTGLHAQLRKIEFHLSQREARVFSGPKSPGNDKVKALRKLSESTKPIILYFTSPNNHRDSTDTGDNGHPPPSFSQSATAPTSSDRTPSPNRPWLFKPLPSTPEER